MDQFLYKLCKNTEKGQNCVFSLFLYANHLLKNKHLMPEMTKKAAYPDI